LKYLTGTGSRRLISRRRWAKSGQDGLVPCILRSEESSKEYGKTAVHLLQSNRLRKQIACRKNQHPAFHFDTLSDRRECKSAPLKRGHLHPFLAFGIVESANFHVVLDIFSGLSSPRGASLQLKIDHSLYHLVLETARRYSGGHKNEMP